MKLGLHLGLNQVDPSRFSGWNGALSGCWNDASAMAATFALAGYETQGLFDADCTVAALRQVLTETAQKLNAGDTLVFSQSGHGSQSSGTFGNEEGLVMYDGILGESEFRNLLAQFKAGVNLVAILDVCHAAGLARSMPSHRARVAPLFITNHFKVTPLPRADIQATGLVFGASGRDELSLDGDRNGAFTGTLLETLRADMTWREWMTACARGMSQNFPTQHPELLTIGRDGLENERIHQ